ncbi:hypothetical protein QCA50_017512 [Cerrena zonata]|uniref:Uncharacterized protein n=1 Tax=Cerrena zonata TaxID=2478898 RepID=A0AAW0FPP6_9APHY
MSMEDMGAVLDSLTSTSTSPEDESDRSPTMRDQDQERRRREKTRWAIEQALGERAILESCQYAWVELAETSDGV